jgi:hypothetical protein
MPLTELLVSQLVQISVRLEKALLRKSLRVSKTSCSRPNTYVFCSKAQAARVEEAEIVPEQFQDPIMNMAFSQALLVNRRRRRRPDKI